MSIVKLSIFVLNRISFRKLVVWRGLRSGGKAITYLLIDFYTVSSVTNIIHRII